MEVEVGLCYRRLNGKMGFSYFSEWNERWFRWNGEVVECYVLGFIFSGVLDG